MQRIIVHIDFDSFFASVAQQYNPALRNKPLGVTATNGRTCIIAASREAKKYGIKSPSITYEAKQLCPDIVFIPADFVQYWEVSKKFISICKDFSPYVEVFSIDELFIDVTLTTHLFGGVAGIVAKIKERIRLEIGEYISASFGISHNKLLAKLASGLEKPNGVVYIRPDDVESVYAKAKLTDICGIGNRVARRLYKIGVYTLLDLKHISLYTLIAEFGKVEGQFLKSIGLGMDNSIIIPYTQAPEVKSISRNYCLARNEYNKTVVMQNVFELCEEVGIKLRRLGKKAKTVGIYLGGDTNIHGQKTIGFVDSGKEIFEGCLSILRANGVSRETGGDYARQIHVGASGLVDADTTPLSLFDMQGKKERLQSVVDTLNERFGDHTIRNAFLLYADKLTTVPNGFMADRYERFLLSSRA